MSKLAKRAGLAALAYIGLNKALSGINAIRDHVDEAEKLSRALEVSYEKAQELTIAEREAGLAAGSIRSAIEGIAQAQAQGMISADMQNLGFNLSEIADLKPDLSFFQIYLLSHVCIQPYYHLLRLKSAHGNYLH